MLHCRVIADGHAPIHVVSVYSPAWPVPRSRLAGVDLTGVKLDLNREMERLRTDLAATGSDTKIKKIAKRLKVLEAFSRSGVKPDWMIIL